MRNIKLTIEYDGADYFGWQTQNRKTRTIQKIIEEALAKILQAKVNLIAAGRTDSGVHARGQVASFKTYSQIPAVKLQQGLNSLLPPDIVIKKTKEVNPDFHARFDAKEKIYRYTILNQPYPLAVGRGYFYHVRAPLDIPLMRHAAAGLVGRHNFKSFHAKDPAKRNKPQDSRRTIKKINIRRRGRFIDIDIEAAGFLYRMVRTIIGTLVDVGRGHLSAGAIRKILGKKDRGYAGPTAPAKGLCLLKVKY